MAKPGPAVQVQVTLVVLSLALLVPAAARAEGRLLTKSFDGELSLATTIGQRDEGELGGQPGTGIGVHMRASTSFYEIFSDSGPVVVPGYRFGDWWSAEVGFGYLADSDELPIWFALRIEATLRLVYTASENLELFTRGGYLTGTNSAGRWNGGYDALFATAGARFGRVLAEVGYGVSSGLIDDEYTVLLLDLEYYFGDLGTATQVMGAEYLGIRFERLAGEGTDLVNVRLTASFH